MSNSKTLILTAASAVILTACGSGSSSTPEPIPPVVVTPDPTPVTGTISAEYISEDSNILAGDDGDIAAVQFTVANEDIKVSGIFDFNIGTPEGAENTLSSASLVLNNSVVATTDIELGTGLIDFRQLEIVLPQGENQLSLNVATSSIGQGFPSEPVFGIEVSDFNFDGLTLAGAGTDNIITVPSNTGRVSVHDIVPVLIVPTVVTSFGNNDREAEFIVVAESADDGNVPVSTLTKATFDLKGITSTFKDEGGLAMSLFHNGMQVGTGSTSDADDTTIEIILDDPVSISDDENLTISSDIAADIRLLSLDYTVEDIGFTSKQPPLELGTFVDQFG